MSDAHVLLKEPWSELSRQREGAKFGIWIFIASEVLFFGALFLAYAAARFEHPEAFEKAAKATSMWFGTINTFVLLTSSLTVAVAAQAAKADFPRLVRWCLAATAALGIAFLIFKGFEYNEDILEHLVPGPGFALEEPAAQLFFAFYWLITGVHAMHLTIGIVLVSRLTLLGALGRMPLKNNPELEITALYWGFVDIVWILAYSQIYLPGRAS